MCSELMSFVITNASLDIRNVDLCGFLSDLSLSVCVMCGI